MENEDRHPIDLWTERLDQKEMPAFAATARTIAALSEDEDIALAEVSKLVLQDSGTTSSVLKRANSAWHRTRRGGRIATVSRAVVLLGIGTVINICLTHALVESIKQGRNRRHVSEEMALSFHAAVQARGFAERGGDEAPEELFIASLLHRLGPIAFWSFAEGAEPSDVQKLVDEGTSEAQAEERVLGFRLDDLTARLCREWKLSAILEDALSGKLTHRVRTAVLSQRLAQAASQGWEEEQTKGAINTIGGHLNLNPQVSRQLALDNAEEAVRASKQLGAEFAGRLIPAPKGSKWAGAGEEIDEPETAAEAGARRALGLELLGELTRVIASGEGDLSHLLSLALEGIYRGVGMKRVLFAMLSPDRKRLALRHGIGIGLPPVGSTLCEITSFRPNLFSHQLELQEELWFKEDNRARYKELVTDEVKALTGGHPCFIMPTMVNNKPIGLFYADRAGDAPLDTEAFQLFWQFCQQVNLGLNLLSLARK